MRFTLHIDKLAAKTIKSLDKPTQKRRHARLTELALNPHDSRISNQVIMGERVRKSRVGNWRIFFEINEEAKTVMILTVKPRSSAY
jgi:mRNA-degrading endonuclease RelE of RelBE toxin-antitoxin system